MHWLAQQANFWVCESLSVPQSTRYESKKKKTTKKHLNSYSLIYIHSNTHKDFEDENICIPSLFTHYNENTFGTCMKTGYSFVSLTSYTPKTVSDMSPLLSPSSCKVDSPKPTTVKEELQMVKELSSP